MAKENIYGNWSPEVVKKFKQWQLRTIVVSMIGYAIYYFVRKNFSIAMPGLTAQYGISNTSFGIVIGIGSLIYGLSRFINGFVVDRYSARAVMAIGLLLCALSNFAFGFGVNISSWITGVNQGPDFINMLVLLMGATIVLNQLFQGVGYPPCARLLPCWIHPSELATKMSIWNTSHSIGAATAVVVCGYIMGSMGTDLSANPEIINTIATNLGLDKSVPEHMETILSYARHWDAWKWCFWLPGCFAVAGAAWLYIGLRDDPRSVGLPELPATKTGKKDNGHNPSQSKFLKVMVWTNRWIWTLCIANVFVYVMRMGILDWGPKFLTEARGMSIEDAAWSVGVFEIFAIVGTIAAGWCTDHIFKGKAHRMCLVCMVSAVIFMSIFILFPGLPMILSICVLAMAGFFIYGPQALIGIASANHATKEASATANGLAGIFGYVGSFLSAIGIGIVADHWGWNMVFYLIIGVGVLGAITFITMWAAPRDGYERSNAFYAREAAENGEFEKAVEESDKDIDL
ncbi:MAG: MFS transporter [Muribaculaceae bacterium]|nr:MFS transporter [Muribaculaceae bacterium]